MFTFILGYKLTVTACRFKTIALIEHIFLNIPAAQSKSKCLKFSASADTECDSTNLLVDVQAGRRLDSAPVSDVVALATKVGPAGRLRW